MIVSDNTIQAEELSDFFKVLAEKGINVSKKMAKNVLKNPSRALDITTNIATSAAIRNPRHVMKSPAEPISFITQVSDCTEVNLFQLWYIYGAKM